MFDCMNMFIIDFIKCVIFLNKVTFFIQDIFVLSVQAIIWFVKMARKSTERYYVVTIIEEIALRERETERIAIYSRDKEIATMKLRNKSIGKWSNRSFEDINFSVPALFRYFIQSDAFTFIQY